MKEKQNIGELDWTLAAKYFSGEATTHEKKQVEEWVSQSDANREELLKISRMLDKTDFYYQSKKFDSAAAWQKVNSKTGGHQNKIIRFSSTRNVYARMYKYAAIAVIAVTLGILGYYVGFRNVVDDGFEEVVSAEKQSVTEYVLPDGSMVALNSNSKLVFPKAFKGNMREVTIVGEAFFDVTPNPEKPFVIHAGNARVKVLGTSFNVQAYPENETVEVVVKTGKVQVSAEAGGEPAEKPEIVLLPGEKATVFSANKKLAKSVNTDPNFMAWKTQNLVFNETPLSEVATYLEKVYHVSVQLKDENLNDLPLTATFNKKPIEFVLNVIQLTFNLDLTVEDDTFILSGQKNDM